MRVKRDIESPLKYLSDGTTVMIYPNKETYLYLKCIIEPTQNSYQGGSFSFNINISKDYPYKAPNVVCITNVK